MKSGKASRLRTLTASGLPIGWGKSSFRFHTRTTSQRTAPYAGAKLAYISLNTPTACPPRTAVSVNRPFCNRRRCWVTFGHELDQVCDFPNDVSSDHSCCLSDFLCLEMQTGHPLPGERPVGLRAYTHLFARSGEAACPGTLRTRSEIAFHLFLGGAGAPRTLMNSG